MGDLLSKYKNDLEYFKNKAVVMREFIGWRGSPLPVGTLLYVNKDADIMTPYPNFYTVKHDYQVCIMSNRNDFDNIFLFNLKYMAQYYMFFKLGSIKDYEFYLNAKRTFTELGGIKYE